MRTPSSLGAPALVLAAALLMGGCTVSGDGADPLPSGDSAGEVEESPDATSPASPSTPQGPSADELSADVLALAAADLGAPLGGQTIEVLDSSNQPVPVTVEVMDLRQTDHATLLRLQMSSTQEVGALDLDVFAQPGNPTREFFERFGLEDDQNGVRYYPLSWRRAGVDETAPPPGPPNSCICPYRGQSFTLTAEPLIMDVLYGPLPGGVPSVALVSPEGLRIPDLAVEPAA